MIDHSFMFAFMQIRNKVASVPVARLTGSMQPGSALKGHAEEVALSPNQAAHANGPEAVKGQREVQRHDLKVFSANPGAKICHVAYGTGVNTGFFIKKYQGTFSDLRSADRSPLVRAFPQSKMPQIVDHVNLTPERELLSPN
jgi:hypothetical protein